MNWFLNQLRQASTWRGLVWLLTVFGLALKPDQAEAIVTAGMALAGLLGVFLSDDRSHPVERDAVGRGGDSAASGADRVRDDLPELELVESPWGQRIEVARRILAIIISGLFLAALLTSCACSPSVPLARISPQTPTPIPASVLDSGIGINCTWRY